MVTAYSNVDISSYIDQALLNPSATLQELEQCCAQAEQYHFASVCIYPAAVKQAAELLHGRRTGICTVIGFPTGATTTATKLYEAQEAIDNGATELDVVINLGWLKARNLEEIYEEIAQICEEGQPVKAILEMAVLTESEKKIAAEICMEAGAAFLKTSTGWFGGATVADVRLLQEIAQGRVGIKAAGGIRSYEQARELIEAGATRLGTSRGPELVQQQDSKHSEP
ncbi:MAG: deoxyribose-phosphate aldolase [Cyanophyceae cyanobacterium]